MRKREQFILSRFRHISSTEFSRHVFVFVLSLRTEFWGIGGIERFFKLNSRVALISEIYGCTTNFEYTVYNVVFNPFHTFR